jgi:Na+-translocating ferredoxin:NAD+ oxidoreductase subunit G
MSSHLSERASMPAIMLAIFALASAGVLATVDMVTSSQIELRRSEDLERSLAMVIPAALHDNNPVQDAVLLKDEKGGERKVYRATKGGALSGVAFTMLEPAYGHVELIIGIDMGGQVLGVRVLRHTETPGLGDKIEAEKSNWIKGFDGRSLDNTNDRQWAVKKDGGIFDQFSGATITPRAVVRAVYKGLKFFSEHKAELMAAPSARTDKGAGA